MHHRKAIRLGFRVAESSALFGYYRTPLFRDDDHPRGVGRISNVSIENFTCYPVTVRPDGFGGTKNLPRVALMLETNMDHFRISNFRYTDNDQAITACPAIIAKNLCGEKICADGKEYLLAQKSDTVVIDTFKDVCIDLIES